MHGIGISRRRARDSHHLSSVGPHCSVGPAAGPEVRVIILPPPPPPAEGRQGSSSSSSRLVHCESAPTGEEGEVVVRGSCVFTG
jgi:hypothetical protein